MEPLTSSQRFLNACWQKPVDKTPVWFMRQAGRYMSEYRAIRANNTLLEICAQPELAAEVTLQPVKRLGVDAAILFADILLPLIPMGIQLEFAAGEGPVIYNPIQSSSDIAALREVDPYESLSNVLEAIRIVRKELDGKTAVIGFAGAPFTLASYLIEGGSSRNLLKTKQMMYSNPQSWHQLMEKLVVVITDYLAAQVASGAQAVQLFDSWVGTLTLDDYREFVLPYSKSIFTSLQNTGAPTIHFGTGTALLLPLMKDAGANVMGVDWQTPLDWAWRTLKYEVAVQGNLDPVALFAPEAELERRVNLVLNRAGGRRGHIFNLGHGILPNTPVDQVKYVVDLVHAHPGVA